MLVLITYDVNTQDKSGKTRLRKVAKECVNHGQRVQNSVFECILDAAQCKLLKVTLLNIINQETVYDFIILEINIQIKLNIMEQRKLLNKKAL